MRANLIVDARIALIAARAAGHQGTAWSSSPALVESGEAQAIDAHVNAETIRRLALASDEAAHALFTDLGETDETKSFAGLAARLLLSNQRLVWRAAMLSSHLLDGPLVLARLVGEDSALIKRLQTPWDRFLEDHPATTVIDVELPTRSTRDANADLPSLLDRARFEGLGVILTTFARRVADRFGAGPFKNVFIVTENGLSRDVLSGLLRRGVVARTLPLRVAEPQPFGQSAILSEAVSKAVQPMLELIDPRLRPALSRLIVENVLESAARYHPTVALVEKSLKTAIGPGTRAILSNYIGSPLAEALGNVAQRSDLPLVLAQHGVTNEISDVNAHIRMVFESTFSDVALWFSERSRAVNDDVPYSRARSFGIGQPSELKRAGRWRSPRREAPPITYLSTYCPIGNVQNPIACGVPDTASARIEGLIVKEVLGRLPHRVFYKTYPTLRYLDEDPVLASAKQHANIEVFDRLTDFRYLVPDGRVIVTARATSTMSWALMSGKPVVFINFRDQSPLREACYAALHEAVFVLDADASDFHEKARAFLSQPIEKIESSFAEKERKRRDFILEYIGDPDGKAGRRGADVVLSLPRMVR